MKGYVPHATFQLPGRCDFIEAVSDAPGCRLVVAARSRIPQAIVRTGEPSIGRNHGRGAERDNGCRYMALARLSLGRALSVEDVDAVHVAQESVV